MVFDLSQVHTVQSEKN